MEYLLITIFAILNRARGSQLFGFTNSTSEGRIVSMLGMGVATSMLRIGDTEAMLHISGWTFAALMFWCVFAWDCYWGMEIGTTTPPRPAFAPVDRIMKTIWPAPSPGTFSARLWGLLAMALRMTLAAPWVVGLAYLGGHPENAWVACFTPLLAVPYLVWGLVFHYWPKFDAYTIELSELCVGAMLGAMAIIALS